MAAPGCMGVTLRSSTKIHHLPIELEPLLCLRSVRRRSGQMCKIIIPARCGAVLCVGREIALAYLRRLEAGPDRR